MPVIILFIYKVCFIAVALGVTYEVIQDQPGDDLQCDSMAVISCKFAVNTSIIRWKIAPDVQNTLITAATCFSNSCSVHSLFATNYSFTFDKHVGVSNVTIKKVSFEIQNLEFRCDDSSTLVSIKYNVTEPPTKQTTVTSNTTNELRVETACVYPTENIVIKWYSRMNESSERIPHETSPTRRNLCNTSEDCILAYESARIISVLNLSQLKVPVKQNAFTSQYRIFEVEIIYDLGNLSFVLGNFSVQAENGYVATERNDKRDDINFPFLDVYVPRATSNGVNYSQLVHLSRACSDVKNLKGRTICIAGTFLKQGYRYHGLRKKSDNTETTNNSTVILTPTPTNVITSTLSSVITPTQTIVISPTPTTVVSPTPTIVLPSSTDKTSSSTKQNFPSTSERNEAVLIASVTGGAVILVLIISACVCCMKRKSRNKKKAKKHVISKEDTNVQENKL